MATILETSRLILREFVPEDADALARVICDREAMRYYPIPFERPDADEWIARNRRRCKELGHGLWAIDLKSTAEMIGDCGITIQNVEGEDLPEIGYHLRRDHWGRGLATEAARACRDYAFTRLAVPFVISLIRPENIPSCRVAERNGMTIWKQTMHANLAHFVYRISRAEWQALSARLPGCE
jgi:ribosomal-protein-alanine N-acetyltransferase